MRAVVAPFTCLILVSRRAGTWFVGLLEGHGAGRDSVGRGVKPGSSSAIPGYLTLHQGRRGDAALFDRSYG